MVNDDDLKKVLFDKIAIANRPRHLQRSQLDLLNGLTDLVDVPYIWSDKAGNLRETVKRHKPRRSKAQKSATPKR